MMSLLNWRVWAAIALAVLLAGTHWKAYVEGGKSVQAKWDADKVEQLEQTNKLQQEAAQATADLQAKADQLRRTKNAQIDRLNSELSAALDSLRDRPARPGAGDLPGNAGSGPAAGCTGAELYRPDAQFLARLAAQAERLRADLDQCQTAYGNARAALSK